jgi:hypothetical protein
MNRQILTTPSALGLATEFRSEKIPRNRLGTDSVIPRKKVLIPRVFRVPRKVPFRSSERNGTEFRGKLVFRNSQNNLTNWFVCTLTVLFSGPQAYMYAVYININILALVLPTRRAFGRTQSPPLVNFFMCFHLSKRKRTFLAYPRSRRLFSFRLDYITIVKPI